MKPSKSALDEVLEDKDDYKYGFTTNVESDVFRKGLDEDVIRAISKKKNEPDFMLDFRLKAYQMWLTM